jgi:aryl-alcohol dehydrogenase-like predicted oxidoreductase
LREAFERSRERLGRDVVDCVLLHNPSAQAFVDSGTAGVLEEFREKRWLRAWGASVGSVEAGRAAIAAGAQVLELAYNVFHTKELDALGDDIRAKDVGILARSVLLHGLLCGLWPSNREFAEGDHRAERWSSDELRKRIVQLNALRPLVAEQTPSLRSIALRFALANTAIASVVIGPRNALQLDQLVREAGRTPPYLEPERFLALSERLQSAGVLR